MSLPIDSLSAEPSSLSPREHPFPPAFRRLMVNSLVSGVTSTFLWFALTFWVYLETRSVVTTGVIAGTFSLVAAIVGPFIGTFVDHHRKHTSLVVTSAVAVAGFAVPRRSSTGTAPTAYCSSTTRGSGCWSLPP
jgi:DHA3 family multidrug efflux protein-like MFS transporter